MKTDIILAGVGGQGILSIAATIGTAALKDNLHMKQSEVHGMSQRGGAVESHLRISDSEIASDLIPKGSANCIISVEPMESLRYLPYLSPDGWIITNTTPYVNITDYPNVEEVLAKIKTLKNCITIDADAMAKKIRSPKSSNMIVLGAAIPFLPIPYENYVEGLRSIFGRKGEAIVNVNIEALRLGYEFAKQNSVQ